MKTKDLRHTIDEVLPSIDMSKAEKAAENINCNLIQSPQQVQSAEKILSKVQFELLNTIDAIFSDSEHVEIDWALTIPGMREKFAAVNEVMKLFFTLRCNG